MTAQPHIFFDLDGTLTDPAPGITGCIRHAADALGVSVEGELSRFIGPPLRESFAQILGTAEPAAVEEAVRLYRERFATVGLYDNAVYEGVHDVLREACGRGYRLLVATSKPKVYADRIVDHFALREHIAEVYGPSLGGDLSDKAQLLAVVLQREQLDPSQGCMVGDREHDVLGARAHAIPAIGVSWGYGTSRELHAAGAHAVVDEVADLLAAVEGVGAPLR